MNTVHRIMQRLCELGSEPPSDDTITVDHDTLQHILFDEIGESDIAETEPRLSVIEGLNRRMTELLAEPHGMACGGTCSICVEFAELQQVERVLSRFGSVSVVGGEARTGSGQEACAAKEKNSLLGPPPRDTGARDDGRRSMIRVASARGGRDLIVPSHLLQLSHDEGE